MCFFFFLQRFFHSLNFKNCVKVSWPQREPIKAAPHPPAPHPGAFIHSFFQKSLSLKFIGSCDVKMQTKCYVTNYRKPTVCQALSTLHSSFNAHKTLKGGYSYHRHVAEGETESQGSLMKLPNAWQPWGFEP